MFFLGQPERPTKQKQHWQQQQQRQQQLNSSSFTKCTTVSLGALFVLSLELKPKPKLNENENENPKPRLKLLSPCWSFDCRPIKARSESSFAPSRRLLTAKVGYRERRRSRSRAGIGKPKREAQINLIVSKLLFTCFWEAKRAIYLLRSPVLKNHCCFLSSPTKMLLLLPQEPSQNSPLSSG